MFAITEKVRLNVMIFRLSRLLFTAAFLMLLAAGCSSPEQKEAAYIKRGNELYADGKYEKARVAYKNAARIKPSDPEIAYRMGLVDEAEGDYRGAFGNFNHAEQEDAHFNPALIKLALYYLAAEQPDDARKRVDSVLAADKDNPGAHAVHAALLLRDKDYDGTEKEARFAMSKDPTNVVPYTVLIGMYAAKGDDDKALAMADDGIAHNPKSLPLLILKTQIYERTNNLPKIAETYQAIFKIAPDDAHYRVMLASLYLKAGKLDDAEATLRAGVAALPDNWDLRHQLVVYLYDHRGLDAAEKEIQGYMKAYPERDDLYTWLVDLYVNHGDIDRAVDLLKQVIAKNADDKRGLAARTALARINYIKGDKDAANKMALDVLKASPNDLDARFVKARIEADNGDYENAIADLRLILRDQPKAKEALHILAETLLRQDHIDLAIDTLNQLMEIDPLNFPARVRLAQLYHLNHDSKHAMDLLFFVTKADAKYPVGWETTARIAIDTKDWSTAEMAIKTLDGLEGQHMTATFLRGEMEAATDKTDQAITTFKDVINADPNAAIAEHALIALVDIYKSQNKLDEATTYIESLKSKNPIVTTILGETYLESGKSDQAAANFDAAISTNSPEQTPYIDRARMFMYDHKPELALETLKKGATVTPADIRAPMMEAQILGELGRYQQAIELYENLLNRNQSLNTVANNLAEIIADYEYNDQNALAHAHNIAERFASSTSPLLLDTLAWVFYRQGDIEQAQTVMERAMKMKGDIPPQIHYHYGAILVKANNVVQAKDELEKATIKNADYPGLDDAKKLLSNL